jgi:DNA-3-methyladenine glycosylase II
MAAPWQVLARRDARLGAVIRLVGPRSLEPTGQSPYEALLSAIAHQQLHAVAARAILNRLCALDGRNRYPSASELLAIPDELLRGVGLSRAKLAAMRDVAARALDGTVPDLVTMQSMDDEAVIERLVAVRGVGRWTAQMLLISTLGRPDVMPADDFGVRLGYQWAFGLEAMPSPKALATACEPYAPYRSTVALYLWRYVDAVREAARSATDVPKATAPRRSGAARPRAAKTMAAGAQPLARASAPARPGKTRATATPAPARRRRQAPKS